MDWNEKALSLFRATPERMAALTPADLSPERQLDGRLSALTIQENLQRVLQGETVICDWVHRRSDGTDFPCEIALRRIDVGGEILIQGIVRDLTERKRAEEERLKLERQMLQVAKLESLGVLAGGIAHDFNNLLTAILGHTDLALQELPRSSPARDNLREVRDSSLRAAELCRQMLAYSGRGRFVIEDLDLTELVETMVKLLMSSTSKKATLDLQLERNLPPVRGDATQIRQVLMNLVINASEALEDRSGTIGISTGSMDCSAEYLEEARVEGTLPAGRYVWMEVTDTGCGMDAATLSRMFEPFFTTKFTGRGLGLSALLGIVRGHRAGLRVRSRPGQGTTFRVLFPAADPSHRASAPAPEGSRAWKGSGTVLLVEDEEPVRAVARRMLERLGFQVLTAVNGREGVEIFRKRSTDIRLVLLDLTMPELDGEETYRELSRIDPAVRAILASGYSRTESASRPGAPGLAGFIQKPYTLGALEKTLRAVLEAAASNPRSG